MSLDIRVFFQNCEFQQVNGVPVEVVYVTIYSRQSWLVLMVDLVAACSMGQYYNLRLSRFQSRNCTQPCIPAILNR